MTKKKGTSLAVVCTTLNLPNFVCDKNLKHLEKENPPRYFSVDVGRGNKKKKKKTNYLYENNLLLYQKKISKLHGCN